MQREKVFFAGLALMALAFLDGCTFIGAAVGSSVPKYEELPPSGVDALRPGTRVDVDEVDPPRHVSGRLESVNEDGVRVLPGSGDPVQDIPQDGIRKLRVANGSHWIEGAVAGLAVDVLVGLVLYAAAESASRAGLRTLERDRCLEVEARLYSSRAPSSSYRVTSDR
jgi:hypothetical protein